MKHEYEIVTQLVDELTQGCGLEYEQLNHVFLIHELLRARGLTDQQIQTLEQQFQKEHSHG